MELMKEFTFEASHRLPRHKGKCARLHGHSWKFRIYCEGKIDPHTHMVVDFYDMGQVGKKIVELLDHKHLGVNDFLDASDPTIVRSIPIEWRVHFDYMRTDFYPTSEN